MNTPKEYRHLEPIQTTQPCKHLIATIVPTATHRLLGALLPSQPLSGLCYDCQ